MLYKFKIKTQKIKFQLMQYIIIHINNVINNILKSMNSKRKKSHNLGKGDPDIYAFIYFI